MRVVGIWVARRQSIILFKCKCQCFLSTGEKHSSSSAAYEMYSTPNIIGLWSRQWFRARVLIFVQLPSVEPFIPVSPPPQPLQVAPLSCVPLSDLHHFVKSFRLVLGCKSEAQQPLPQSLKAPLSHSALYNTFELDKRWVFYLLGSLNLSKWWVFCTSTQCNLRVFS